MLWLEGRNNQSFDNLAALLNEGVRAVRECSPGTRVMLQLDNGCKNEMYRWWFDNIIEREVTFDLIGVSYYPYWHGTLEVLQVNLNDIAVRYGKDIIVVETAYPFAAGSPENQGDLLSFEEYPGYPFPPEGQARMLADIMTIVRAVPNGRDLGVMWWDATWTNVPGNGWDPFDSASPNNWQNQALFDFESRALPAMKLFRQS